MRTFSNRGLAEEAPLAYKDIHDVVGCGGSGDWRGAGKISSAIETFGGLERLEIGDIKNTAIDTNPRQS